MGKSFAVDMRKTSPVHCPNVACARTGTRDASKRPTIKHVIVAIRGFKVVHWVKACKYSTVVLSEGLVIMVMELVLLET